MMYIWGMINIDLLKGSLLLVLLAGQTGLEQNKLPNDKNNVWKNQLRKKEIEKADSQMCRNDEAVH